ncbi:recombinase family protein [Reyranella sp.]|uniref:recombinase family protein n=1 Tax=Reyranella sp. TaxID=1929291 RepID=UPI002730D6B4|nr:recombinase family protein [Reyranella sp.]MDP2373279.1 recombinase family protein [Reyranella sp.]
MTPVVRRCAIYTRKSTEEGLDQAFNSLDAQREACEAYIKSQAHEGWKLVKTAYDDGGFSGGSMERPAVKRLMTDLKQRLIDIVVVYKVDRLTRSLADFAKIVEILDGHGASFVSVTQQFNTTSSMGRLTLNVLLSFAQFEREVTGERIRDKIAASKRNGMWMGGTTPIGYDARDRQLMVNEAEAETVRLIYGRYLELGCVSALAADLRDSGIVSKAKVSKKGNHYGGQPLGRGALYHLLQNRLYRGMVVHKGEAHPGQHPAIVPQELWDEVQQALAGNRVEHRRARSTGSPHLLIGRLRDDGGNLMIPTYTRKANGQQYRYYASPGLIPGSKGEAGSIARIPAGAIEGLVESEIRRRLPEGERKRWEALPPAERVNRLRSMIASAVIKVDEVVITLTEDGGRAVQSSAAWRDKGESPPMVLNVSVRLKPSAGGTKIVSLDGRVPEAARVDKALVRAIARANHWRELLESGTARSAYDLARHENCRVSYIQRHLPLAFLSPRLVEEILVGRQSGTCTLGSLAEKGVPMRWSAR